MFNIAAVNYLDKVALAISKNDSTALTEVVVMLKINNLKPLPEYLFGKLAVDDLGTALVPEQQFCWNLVKPYLLQGKLHSLNCIK